MTETITIVCPECGLKIDTPRCDTDPPSATELRGIRCGDCDNGGYDMPFFFDANGNEVCGGPQTFNDLRGTTDD